MSSALSSAATLNAGDKIDGGAGADTLKVDMQSNFAGFNSTGGLSNVETVDLSNTGAIAREFNATGVTGVQQYNLTGNINLSNLADTAAAVAVSDRSADLSLTYAAKVTDGTSDALNLSVSNVGTADDPATTTSERDAAGVTAAGIETLNLSTAGTNVLNLTNVAAAKAINVSGTGALDTSVAAATKTFDASANSGKVAVDLLNASGVTSVATGAGDDTITAVAGNDLTANATIAGGAGNDTLALTGSGTTQYQMSGVETVSLGTLAAGGLTFSAAKSTGIDTIEAGSAFNAGSGTATFAGLGSSNIAFDLKEGSASSIIADQTGASTVTVSASAASIANKATQPDSTSLTVNNSSAVNLAVGEYASYTGTITAAKATSVEISGNVTGAATVNAAAATSAVLDTTGASVLALNAAALTSLDATVAAGTTTANTSLDLSGGADLSALESLTASVGANGTLTLGDLASVNNIDLSGTGAAELGKLGDAALDYGVTVKADGLSQLTTGEINVGAGQSVSVDASTVAGAVTLGNIAVATTGTTTPVDTGSINVNVNGTTGDVILGTLQAKNVTVDATGALGAVTGVGGVVPDITVGNTLVFNGSDLNDNSANISATGASLNATLNGGIGDDTFNITGATSSITGVASTLKYTVSGDLGIGSNSVNIDASSASQSVTIDVSGLKVGTDGSTDLIGTALGDKFIGSAGADTFHIATTGTGTNGALSAVDADVVTDFSLSAHDTLSFATLAVGDGSDYAEGGAAVADFAAALDAANHALNGSVTYVAEQVGSDTYVFYGNGTVAGATDVVKLVGVDLAHVDATAIAIA